MTKLRALRTALVGRPYHNERYEDIAQAVSQENGSPITWAREAQAWAGRAHLEAAIKALEDYGMALGFSHVASGPLVRSSYHADQQAAQAAHAARQAG